MALLKEVMEEEEERSEVKGHPSSSPHHGTQPTSTMAKSTPPGDSYSEGEDIDDNMHMATAEMERLKLEEEDGERETSVTAKDGSSSNGDSDDEDLALSSLIRCAYSHDIVSGLLIRLRFSKLYKCITVGTKRSCTLDHLTTPTFRTILLLLPRRSPWQQWLGQGQSPAGMTGWQLAAVGGGEPKTKTRENLQK